MIFHEFLLFICIIFVLLPVPGGASAVANYFQELIYRLRRFGTFVLILNFAVGVYFWAGN